MTATEKAPFWTCFTLLQRRRRQSWTAVPDAACYGRAMANPCRPFRRRLLATHDSAVMNVMSRYDPPLVTAPPPPRTIHSDRAALPSLLLPQSPWLIPRDRLGTDCYLDSMTATAMTVMLRYDCSRAVSIPTCLTLFVCPSPPPPDGARRWPRSRPATRALRSPPIPPSPARAVPAAYSRAAGSGAASGLDSARCQ